MGSTENGADDMRQAADWMNRGTDDMILEALRDQGALTPQILAQKTGRAANYCGDRVRELSRYGLAERLAHGVYTITEEGEAYLDEELDASTLREGEID